MKYYRIFIICLFISIAVKASAAEISIEIPQGGFTTKRIHIIKGTVQDFSENRIVAVLNGIPQTVPLSGGRFSFNTVVAPGLNIVEIRAGRSSKKVSFYAKVPRRDVKILLTWDTPTDVDLWVIDPKGDKCYYGNKRIPSGGNLDVDVIAGYGPETFTMANALPGTYSVQVQYYGSNNQPVTRVNLYVVLYEGTPRERRKHFQFVMTKEHQVYQIADFQIEGGE